MMNSNNGNGSTAGNSNLNIEKYLFSGTKSIKDYILLFRNNFKFIALIALSVSVVASVYAFLSKDIYISTVTIRISQPNKNVLENVQQYSANEILDRYITNEIGVVSSLSTMEKTAVALIDSFKSSKNKDLFSIVREPGKGSNFDHKSADQLTGLLEDIVAVQQNPGTDVILISVQSKSAYEAALIANSVANEYRKVNTEISRDKLTNIRKFLEEQAADKQVELKNLEDSLLNYKQRGGIVSLDIQSTGLLQQLSQIDARKEATKIELSTSNEVLKQYKFFLRKQDPQLVDYLENQTSQAYISALQQQLAEIQVERDLAVSISNANVDLSPKISEYDRRISELKQKLNSTISTIKADAFSGNPQQASDLGQRLIEEEIKNSTLNVQLDQLEATARKYQGNLQRFPQASTVLSQYQRDRDVLQQIFLVITERYQEALINELSETGNATIINPAYIPNRPAKPNRLFMILVGLILGPILGFAFVLIRDHFDDSVKTPDDIEKEDISFLSWIPHYTSKEKGKAEHPGYIIAEDLDSPITESFKTIKARIQQNWSDSQSSKIILITSPAEHEGKSFVAANLAGSFAFSNKRTILIDCDLRRPTVHITMGVQKKYGLVDYLSGKVKLDEIIKPTKTKNLSFITSGSIPANPNEVLESKSFSKFLQSIKDYFDIIIIDSPPIVAVIDSEILAKQVDGTVLIISADKTEKRLMKDAVELLKRSKTKFLGSVLNNFKYKSGYGYYYKYHYSYSTSSGRKNIVKGSRKNS